MRILLIIRKFNQELNLKKEMNNDFEIKKAGKFPAFSLYEVFNKLNC